MGAFVPLLPNSKHFNNATYHNINTNHISTSGGVTRRARHRKLLDVTNRFTGVIKQTKKTWKEKDLNDSSVLAK